mgnify:CR=1 FL=1
MMVFKEANMDDCYIQDLFNECSVGKALGIEILEVREGYAKGMMTIKKEHLNVFDSAHGGVIFTLADHIGGACGNTLGKKAVLIESSIQYFKPVFEGNRVYAEASIIHKGKKIGRLDVKVFTEDSQDVALMHMVFYITHEKHTEKTA